MNIHAAMGEPEAVGLTVEDFLLLKRAGTFRTLSKIELLDGELFGTPRIVASDASLPIRLRLRDYHRLARAGRLGRTGKTELIDGFIYKMSPQHRPHGFVKDELSYRLRRALERLGSNLHVATAQSVAMPPFDEPQPDIVLTREPRGTGPMPGRSVALIVEVADTSLRLDRDDKSFSYARHGVPEYWVADVNGRVIHQMWAPAGEFYAERREVAVGAVVEAVTVAGLRVETREL